MAGLLIQSLSAINILYHAVFYSKKTKTTSKFEKRPVQVLSCFTPEKLMVIRRPGELDVNFNPVHEAPLYGVERGAAIAGGESESSQVKHG